MGEVVYRRTLIDKLREWKVSPIRKPLIIRGVRQVGKTTLIKDFSAEFDHFIYLNLDKLPDRQIFEKNDNIEIIIRILFVRDNISPDINASILIFIDEIQNSPKAVQLLRYFYEEAKHIFVIAAGSLLETMLGSHISYPVGRVEYLVLRPFSFEEFILASNEKLAWNLLHQIPFPEYGHTKLLELFKEYCLIGGMPAVIEHYLGNRDLVAVGQIYEGLINTYLEDVEKYSQNESQRKVIRHLINHAIRFAGERIKFEGFAESKYKSKDVGECFRILEKTYFLSLVYPTTFTKPPLAENVRKSPKLQIVDSGLVNYYSGVRLNILTGDMLESVFEGKIAEHIVGQEIMAYDTRPSAKNYFWVKEKKQSNAEVDYIISMNGLLIPIEVKLGKAGRLRSLMEYIDLCPHNLAVRIYSGEFREERLKTLKGKDFVLINLPFYLTLNIREYIRRNLPENLKNLNISQ